MIGSGIGGLCCAAMLAAQGVQVTVAESHDIPGGAAHAWVQKGYHFESGPSLFSGMDGRCAQIHTKCQQLSIWEMASSLVWVAGWKCFLGFMYRLSLIKIAVYHLMHTWSSNLRVSCLAWQIVESGTGSK